MNAKDNPLAAAADGGYDARISFGDAAGDAPPPLVKDTTTAAFGADVVQESRNQPVLVDFWAPWCGPCRQLTPMLEKVVREARGAVKLVKMNIDEHPAIAGQLGIQSIPAVIAFKNGQPVDGFLGAVPESQIRDFIKRIGTGAKDEVAEAIAEAQSAEAAGDMETAAQIYEAVLSHAPDNAAALVGLAGIVFAQGDVERARELIESVPEKLRETPEAASVRARIALAEQVRHLGDPRELRRRLDTNPDDHDARFDLAMIENALGERDSAADNLLQIVRKDRGWRDDGARNQLLKFFEAWGMTDEATLAARRKLSSLLFS